MVDFLTLNNVHVRVIFRKHKITWNFQGFYGKGVKRHGVFTISILLVFGWLRRVQKLICERHHNSCKVNYWKLYSTTFLRRG